jgi:hypothetical protein
MLNDYLIGKYAYKNGGYMAGLIGIIDKDDFFKNPDIYLIKFLNNTNGVTCHKDNMTLVKRGENKKHE